MTANAEITELACVDCGHFAIGACTVQGETAEHPDRLRDCADALIAGYREMILPGMRVLEIGCGSSSAVRNFCRERQAQFEGIDILDGPAGSAATRNESIEFCSFPDEYFDLVIANQSLEHWDENGCRTGRGLAQALRVARPGGLLLFNVPIHLHGAREFVEADFETILAPWKLLGVFPKLTLRGKNHRPLPPVVRLAKYRRLANASAYILALEARRPDSLPVGGLRPYRIRNRWFRELAGHRPGYFLFKVIRKTGTIFGSK